MPPHAGGQADLFEPVDPETGSVAASGTGIAPLPLLAIPCGFRNRRNAPCRRFGDRPLMIDGAPFHHAGWRLVHCDPLCFQGVDAEPGDSEAVRGGRGGAEAGPVG